MIDQRYMQLDNPPSNSSSGNFGARATNNPPNPHPISATVISLLKDLLLVSGGSFGPVGGAIYFG